MSLAEQDKKAKGYSAAFYAWHAAAERECVADLLRGCPPEGGTVSRELLESMVIVAFQAGATEQLTHPAPDFTQNSGPVQ